MICKICGDHTDNGMYIKNRVNEIENFYCNECLIIFQKATQEEINESLNKNL